MDTYSVNKSGMCKEVTTGLRLLDQLVGSRAFTYHLSSERLKASEKTIENGTEVRGYDFNKGLDYEAMFKTYVHTGF